MESSGTSRGLVLGAIADAETANAAIKKLKLEGDFTKFLQSCTIFAAEKASSSAEVSLLENSFPEITS